jgi:hypothetical protein
VNLSGDEKKLVSACYSKVSRNDAKVAAYKDKTETTGKILALVSGGVGGSGSLAAGLTAKYGGTKDGTLTIAIVTGAITLASGIAAAAVGSRDSTIALLEEESGKILDCVDSVCALEGGSDKALSSCWEFLDSVCR